MYWFLIALLVGWNSIPSTAFLVSSRNGGSTSVFCREHQRIHAGREQQWDARTARKDTCCDGRLLSFERKSPSAEAQRELAGDCRELLYATKDVSTSGTLHHCGKRLFLRSGPRSVESSQSTQSVQSTDTHCQHLRRCILALASPRLVAGNCRELSNPNTKQRRGVLRLLPKKEHPMREATEV